jgi:hypothetical protein
VSVGVHPAISYDKFPAQGADLHKSVEVCFNCDMRRTIRGTIVRDDQEDPFVTIILLDNGRLVTAAECQYRVGDI